MNMNRNENRNENIKRKYCMTLSEAAMTIGGLKVPSDLIGSIEIAEALRMALIALEMQINLGQMITDIQEDFKPEDSYSSSLVLDMLNDNYMMSEVNLIGADVDVEPAQPESKTNYSELASRLFEVVKTYSPYEVDSDYNETNALQDLKNSPECIIDYLLTLIEDAM